MTERIKQINALLQSQLGSLLLKELDFDQGLIVTIVEVETLKDLSLSRVFVSVLPQSEGQNVLRFLNRKAKTLQKGLSHQIVLRKTPKLVFLPYQETAETKVEKILENL